VLDKPAGVTSTYAVGAMRRAFGARKAGHAGTLDPAATGVLPIAFGEATKDRALRGRRGEVLPLYGALGRTDGDRRRRRTRARHQRPAQRRGGDFAAVGPIHGEILQTPPAYSAIKVAGRRAYDLARGAKP
jgi:tRNA pseudouridine55 synthase